MPAKKTAPSVSDASLARTIEEAIQVATMRLKPQLTERPQLDHWEIIGRRVEEALESSKALSLATAVAEQMKPLGVRAEPVVSRIGKDTWIGFVARSTILRVPAASASD